MSLATNVSDLATRVGTEFKSVRTQLTGNASGSLSALTTTDKTSLVAAVNEVADAVAGSSGIDDGTTGTTTTWSSSKINTQIGAATSALVNGAQSTLDTLGELATALGNDANFATTTATALGNRVRTDTAAQGLNSTQQGNARTNIAAAAASDLTTLSTNVGDTTTNFVTAFEAGLV
jgi:hypothetical protein